MIKTGWPLLALHFCKHLGPVEKPFQVICSEATVTSIVSSLIIKDHFKDL